MMNRREAPTVARDAKDSQISKLTDENVTLRKQLDEATNMAHRMKNLNSYYRHWMQSYRGRWHSVDTVARDLRGAVQELTTTYDCACACKGKGECIRCCADRSVQVAGELCSKIAQVTDEATL